MRSTRNWNLKEPCLNARFISHCGIFPLHQIESLVPRMIFMKRAGPNSERNWCETRDSLIAIDTSLTAGKNMEKCAKDHWTNIPKQQQKQFQHVSTDFNLSSKLDVPTARAWQSHFFTQMSPSDHVMVIGAAFRFTSPQEIVNLFAVNIKTFASILMCKF